MIICDSFDFSNSLTTEKKSDAFDGYKNASKANNSYGKKRKRLSTWSVFWIGVPVNKYLCLQDSFINL